MTETVEERLERITEYAKILTDTESTPILNIADLNWLIARAELVQSLQESYKELTIQENAMQAHYNLAFNNMQMFKKCVVDITIAMNTERPAEEKTKDIRRILDSFK